MSIRIQAYRNPAAILALGAITLGATPAFAGKASLKLDVIRREGRVGGHPCDFNRQGKVEPDQDRLRSNSTPT